MKTVFFHFHGYLVELLRGAVEKQPFVCSFREAQTVKHLIESAGIPHTEVGAILASGQPVDFHYLAQDGEQIDVSVRIADKFTGREATLPNWRRG